MENMTDRLNELRARLKSSGLTGTARAALAMLAVLLAAVAPTQWVTLVVLWAAILWGTQTLFSACLKWVRDRSSTLLVSNTSGTRIYVTLAALLIAAGNGAPTLTLVSIGLICFATIGEQFLRRLLNWATPLTANLPGGDLPLPSRAVSNGLYVSSLVGTYIAVALVTFSSGSIPSWPILLAFGAAAVFALAILVQLLRYWRARRALQANLSKLVDDLAPQLAFHWHAAKGTAYQVTMWLPYLKRVGVPMFVLVRTVGNLTELAELTDVPVIKRTDLIELDDVVRPSLKLMFYSNNAMRNSHVVRYPQLTHIQLNHGDSDKIASISPVFRMFDKNFVAGQAAIDRFAKYGVRTPDNWFVKVGRPQLEDVSIVDGHRQQEGATVLYSPTWSGFFADSDYCSLPGGPAMVQELLRRGCTIVFRPHPYARRHAANTAAIEEITQLLQADAAASGRRHVFGEQAETQWSVVDCFNASDVMISDVSSLVSDYLYSGKPLAMCAVSSHGDEFRNEFPLADATYVLDVFGSEVRNLSAVLDDMLGADSMLETRHELRNYYLADSHGQPVRPFLSAIQELLVEQEERQHAGYLQA